MKFHFFNQDKSISIQIELEDDNWTIQALKNKIMQEMNIENVTGIDLTIIECEIPQRIMGKFTVNAGLLPRLYDHSKIDNFSFKDRNF